jgi:2-polyprenyl-6-methoxyphenol hydroxylase-like FAD-dependent oxidoreductase
MASRQTLTVTDVQTAIDYYAGFKASVSEAKWVSCIGCTTGWPNNSAANRVFLVGDAAHIHSPVGGQGRNTGIQDAYNLAWKLALVLRGDATDTLLDTYATERMRVACTPLNGTAW